MREGGHICGRFSRKEMYDLIHEGQLTFLEDTQVGLFALGWHYAGLNTIEVRLRYKGCDTKVARLVSSKIFFCGKNSLGAGPALNF